MRTAPARRTRSGGVPGSTAAPNDWDNCLDPDFLRFAGSTDLLVSEEVYRRDDHDRPSVPRRQE
ncbi:hypothetical protein AB0M44_29845 [Streptosporangium subroseum]|uniref:hypothetical protein n=1 Tax=Streptosporangium subroseum TaxID=106412 RepID=UPI00342925F7